MSSYATIDRGFFPSSHAPALTAAAADEGVTVGDATLGRDSLIIKPLSIPTAPLVSHAPAVYTVVQGDTLESVGRLFNLPWRYVMWSNPGLRLPLKGGQALKLPPVPGVVVAVKRGDTPASLAAALHRGGQRASDVLAWRIDGRRLACENGRAAQPRRK